jgi:hypothetical protein
METRLSHILKLIEFLENQIQTLKNLVNDEEIAESTIVPTHQNLGVVLEGVEPVARVIHHEESVARLPDPEVEIEPVAVARVLSHSTDTVSPAVETATNTSNRSSHTQKPLTSTITYHGLPGKPKQVVLHVLQEGEVPSSRDIKFCAEWEHQQETERAEWHRIRQAKINQVQYKGCIWAKTEEERKRDHSEKEESLRFIMSSSNNTRLNVALAQAEQASPLVLVTGLHLTGVDEEKLVMTFDDNTSLQQTVPCNDMMSPEIFLHTFNEFCEASLLLQLNDEERFTYYCCMLCGAAQAFELGYKYFEYSTH